MSPGLERIGRHIIRRERAGVWVTVFNMPWRFQCRRCGRKHHHETWRDACLGSMIHNCTPGSLW